MHDEKDIQALRDARAYLRWLQRSGFEVFRSDLQGQAKESEMARTPDTPKNTTSGQAGTESTATAPNAEKSAQFATLSKTVSACRKCGLGAQRKNAVFGVGNPNADLVFIGEAPGAVEDDTGKPFVGPAGRVLTEELAKNGISRDEVFICNIIKCRPPGNRDPLPEEISACEPYLLEQLEIIKPRMLCGLGRYAVGTLLKHPISIMKIRGTWERYHDLPLFVCLHPSAVLHQPNNRPLFNGDIVTLAKAYHARRK
jgi:uracil-DNA glycosylase